MVQAEKYGRRQLQLHSVPNWSFVSDICHPRIESGFGFNSGFPAHWLIFRVLQNADASLFVGLSLLYAIVFTWLAPTVKFLAERYQSNQSEVWTSQASPLSGVESLFEILPLLQAKTAFPPVHWNCLLFPCSIYFVSIPVVASLTQIQFLKISAFATKFASE